MSDEVGDKHLLGNFVTLPNYAGCLLINSSYIDGFLNKLSRVKASSLPPTVDVI